MDKKSFVFFSIVTLLILGAAYAVVSSMQQTANSAETAIDKAVAPFRDSNNALQTQVSQLANPTPTIIPDPATYIHDIRALARLETIQYSVEKVITAEVGQGNLDFLFGDKLLFVAHGIVIGGVDMSKIQPQDLRLANDTLTVRLPEAEVFVATLDNEKSYVYNRETGLLTKGAEDLETLARQAAEKEILKAAMEDGIIKQAQANAELFLYKFFQSLGYKTVVFTK